MSVSVASASAGFEVVHPLRSVGPLENVEPFPTLYWLKEGELHRAVADLERHGWIKQLEAKAQEDKSFASALAADHARYAEARWALLDHAERDFVVERGWSSALRDVGVGGVADFTKVKCLHAHVAHALADRAAESAIVNAVGSWALTKLDAKKPM